MTHEPLRIDVDLALHEAVAPGVRSDELDGLVGIGRQVHDQLLLARARGLVGFADLYMLGREAMRARDAAESLAGRFDNVLVFTEGAEADVVQSVLGPLSHPFHNLLAAAGRGGRPRVIVVDSTDFDQLGACLEAFAPEQALCVCISKSGSDVGHLTQFGVVRDLLRMRVGPGYQDHLVVVTDPAGGALREESLREGLMAFEVPRNVPARHAVLTPVALLPAALAGIDVRAVLAGAHVAAEQTAGEDLRANLSYLWASVLHVLSTAHGRNRATFVAGSHSLGPVAKQLARLFQGAMGRPGESVPGLSCGWAELPRDADALVERCIDGPADTAVILLEVVKAARDRVFPSRSAGLPVLAGRQLSSIAADRRAITVEQLTGAGVPVIRVQVPVLSANTVGALHMASMLAASFGAGLAGRDAPVAGAADALRRALDAKLRPVE